VLLSCLFGFLRQFYILLYVLLLLKCRIWIKKFINYFVILL
jgi:hypothetical protein